MSTRAACHGCAAERFYVRAALRTRTHVFAAEPSAGAEVLTRAEARGEPTSACVRPKNFKPRATCVSTVFSRSEALRDLGVLS